MVQDINNMPIREQVFKKLRQMILSYELKPGDKIIEGKLAQTLEVSRTPVREALHRLEEEGLIEIFPRRHCLVKGITIDSIHEINLIRAKLEPEAAVIATDKLSRKDLKFLESVLLRSRVAFNKNDIKTMIELNDEYHNVIINSAELPRIEKMLENLQDYFMAFRYAFMGKRELAERTLKEHEDILEALKSRDKDVVKEIYEKHVYGILDYEYVADIDNKNYINLVNK
ncbi:GntR family transcriptional regulator [Salinicoccus sp. Marseille-QA3877]